MPASVLGHAQEAQRKPPAKRADGHPEAHSGLCICRQHSGCRQKADRAPPLGPPEGPLMENGLCRVATEHAAAPWAANGATLSPLLGPSTSRREEFPDPGRPPPKHWDFVWLGAGPAQGHCARRWGWSRGEGGSIDLSLTRTSRSQGLGMSPTPPPQPLPAEGGGNPVPSKQADRYSLKIFLLNDTTNYSTSSKKEVTSNWS